MKHGTRLNVGCGSRYVATAAWENLDQRAIPPFVKRHDIREPLPYGDNQFEFIYSSHVIDHFDLCTVSNILRDMHRCLQVNGCVRIAVPDLHWLAVRYLRSYERNKGNPEQHQWYVIEMIDQMARGEYGGEKAKFLALARSNKQIQDWLRPLLGHEMLAHLDKPQVAISHIAHIKHWMYRTFIRKRFEESGERHRWCFDEISLTRMMHEAGFANVQRVRFDQSRCLLEPGERLDVENGCEYKPGSLYIEAGK